MFLRFILIIELIFYLACLINCQDELVNESPFASRSSRLRINYSKLDPILFESLSLNILEMLHLKVLANAFKETDEQALMFLLGEIVKRWRRVNNKHERTVYWYLRQG